MSALKESQVLQAVANPPTFIFVPWTAALLNISIWISLGILMVLFLDLGLQWVIFLMFASHMALISLATKEPHLETLAQAIGFYWKPGGRPNIIPSKHTRFVP